MTRKFFLGAALALASTGALAQNADFLPVCDRTPAVRDEIVKLVNSLQGTQKACVDLTVEDLAPIERVAVANKRIAEFKAGDFSGLPNLLILNIRSNPYKTLPEGLFKGLTKLHTIVIIATGLRYLPDDFLADTPNLQHLHLFRSEVRSISESVLRRLDEMTQLQDIDLDAELQAPERERIESIFSGTNTFVSFI